MTIQSPRQLLFCDSYFFSSQILRSMCIPTSSGREMEEVDYVQKVSIAIVLLLTFHWVEFSHMVVSNYKGCWEMQSRRTPGRGQKRFCEYLASPYHIYLKHLPGSTNMVFLARGGRFPNVLFIKPIITELNKIPLERQKHIIVRACPFMYIF